MRENNKTAIENKAKAAEKIALERKTKEQAERNLQYWADHHADKLELENETAELIEKNSKLVKAIEASINKSTHVGQVSLFGAFCPFVLGGRQPACVQKNKNPSKIQGCPMRSSSAGAEMLADKEKAAENTLCILKGFDAV